MGRYEKVPRSSNMMDESGVSPDRESSLSAMDKGSNNDASEYFETRWVSYKIDQVKASKDSQVEESQNPDAKDLILVE